jgi:DNA-binding protein Alba
MNKYQFVGEKRPHEEQEHEEIPEESIVWIKQQGKPRGYISYTMNLFEEGAETIMLKAMGRAINKAVTIAEILKRKIPLCKFKCIYLYWDHIILMRYI